MGPAFFWVGPEIERQGQEGPAGKDGQAGCPPGPTVFYEQYANRSEQMRYGIIFAGWLIFPTNSFAETVCDVGGISYATDEFSLLICSGDLDHQTAVDCANKFADDASRFKARSELAQAQAECLCRAVNAAVAGSGRYNWLTGQCTVEP